MSSTQLIAIAAAIGMVGIATFQAALALGAPLGRAAWGGKHQRHPTSLRWASGVSVAIWLFAAVVVLGRAGFELAPLPAAFVRWGTWTVAGFLRLGALMNLASSSKWERFLWAPLALVLAGLCLVITDR